ncbi:MAG: preprotein translocase subunit SecY [Solobacterium sp.]|jgi:preprotein translocase subunit SecY|nr:preprotein translocase subunit SecY [Solobacterium sp.]MCH4205857.1 preprotein translocase subunit SecY [Solobacterium sp.]MCH4227358.1 preprotein translocase subunit SecY [Solobacterium sp.]MCH4282645.1 preprotein translocase subunit SecY [Solobacterium sp.]
MGRTFASLFKNKEIRKKIFFTLAMLLIYRVGSAIAVPGVNTTTLSSQIADNSILNMMNLLGGGALEKLSIFAMGVTPYITASIIIQLLSMDVIPALTEMTKSGQTGRMKMEKITRYLGVVLSFVQAYSLVYGFDKQYAILENANLSGYLYTATVLTAGTMFLIWIGDRISMKGIGNGISIIIFAGIVANIPSNFMQVYNVLVAGSSSSEMFNGILQFALYCALYLVIIVFVIVMETAVRKIPIQYTNSTTTRSGSDITFLPLKINSASVIPVIFAQSIITAPQIVISFFNTDLYTTLSSWLSLTSWTGLLLYALLTILFTFFYTDLQVDPEQMADNLGKSGAYIPGIRPGSETKTYLHKVLNRITVLGAAALTIVAVIPYILPMFTSLPKSTSIGGTGIIIVVGVALETMAQLKGQLTQKQYHGFLR